MLKIEQIGDKCTGCLACYNSCQSDAINLQEDENGFLYPKVNHVKCIKCGLCEKSCPELIKNNQRNDKVISSYYGWTNNRVDRRHSTSGGLFTSFAKFITQNEGIVFGAIFDYDFMMVKHVSSNEVGWEKMRKSKYVQSFIGYTYRVVKEELLKGRYVLFVGTPCQVSGLKSFLKEDYDKLITVDFICHGVPSMRLLKSNIDYYFKDKNLRLYDFRSKAKGWTKATLHVKTDTQSIYKSYDEDIYYSAFMNYINLRSSCYNCNYSEDVHVSELTIADFWGYRRQDKNILDERGLSLLLVNNKRGDDFIDQIKENCDVTLKKVNNNISSYVFLTKGIKNKYKKKRDTYLSEIKKLGYKAAARRSSLTIPFKTKMMRQLIAIKKSIKGMK